ncbi:MAG: hypothetical protein JWR33_31 [Naasia sp.]|jgi:hypothetical protein|uniref:DUF3040 domain-containing protein n=1 Tax=Naasia sp. TaxID=2546198 RepID=UPI00263413A8|nr:DUF3040 domain-containing protein [Naasia sp.]MCU1569290.1 hypothetical protein [Naasia sp.]
MPLSEQEQRLLDEMERNLYQNDAEFVATVGGRRGRISYTALVVGVLVAVLGVAVLVAGVVLRQPIIGVGGFVVMFAGVLVALGSPRRPSAAPRSTPSRGGRGHSSGGGFMDRMNSRWERRQGDMGR